MNFWGRGLFVILLAFATVSAGFPFAMLPVAQADSEHAGKDHSQKEHKKSNAEDADEKYSDTHDNYKHGYEKTDKEQHGKKYKENGGGKHGKGANKKNHKITICHNASRHNPVIITIAKSALDAHLAHYDTIGACEYRNNDNDDDDSDGSDSGEEDGDADDNTGGEDDTSDDSDDSDSSEGGDADDDNEEGDTNTGDDDGSSNDDDDDTDSDDSNDGGDGSGTDDHSDDTGDDEEDDDNNENGSEEGDDEDDDTGEDNECDACGGIGGGSSSNSSSVGGIGGLTYTVLEIKEVRAEWNAASSTIDVHWTTNIPATSQVVYGTTSVSQLPVGAEIPFTYGTSTALFASTTEAHSVNIAVADVSARYYLRAVSQKAVDAGRRTVSREMVLDLSGVEVKEIETATTTSESGGGVGSGNSGNTTGTTGWHTLACPAYLETYIKFGGVNDFQDVWDLQVFLVAFEGFTHVPISGTYDEATRDAVKALQAKYSADILSPWGISEPTGYVYLTTQKKINEKFCAHSGIPTTFDLDPAQQYEIQLSLLRDSAVSGTDGRNAAASNGRQSVTDTTDVFSTDRDEDVLGFATNTDDLLAGTEAGALANRETLRITLPAILGALAILLLLSGSVLLVKAFKSGGGAPPGTTPRVSRLPEKDIPVRAPEAEEAIRLPGARPPKETNKKE